MVTKRQIYNTLTGYGIPMSVKGFEYISLAIDGCLNGSMDMHLITKSIYPDIAKSEKVTIAAVERAITHAIRLSYVKKQEPCILERFKVKPTNSEFIATLVYELRED